MGGKKEALEAITAWKQLALINASASCLLLLPSTLINISSMVGRVLAALRGGQVEPGQPRASSLSPALASAVHARLAHKRGKKETDERGQLWQLEKGEARKRVGHTEVQL